MKKIYCVIGKKGTWFRGPWQPEFTRNHEELVTWFEAENLEDAAIMAAYFGYEGNEWLVREATPEETKCIKANFT